MSEVEEPGGGPRVRESMACMTNSKVASVAGELKVRRVTRWRERETPKGQVMEGLAGHGEQMWEI